MSDIDDVWRRKTDVELVDAALVLDEYTEEGRQAIRVELLRRGIAPEALASRRALNEESARQLASTGERSVGRTIDLAKEESLARWPMRF